MTEDTPDPQHGGLLKWLRINVAVAGFGIAVLSGGLGVFGAVFAGLYRSSAFLHQIDEDHAAVEQLHRDMISVDGRFNDLNRERVGDREAGRKVDADLDRRVAVLEAQIQYLAIRTPPSTVLRKQ